MGELKAYPEYKNSGFEWVGDVPTDWQYTKLKRIASVELSNIDKKSRENEIDVLLCNYVDVYYNDIITSELSFMQATAKQTQINKFKLKREDVLITKDSETADDIGVPAWVEQDMENVICGYHLAQIRSSRYLIGKFLFYMLASTTLNSQLHSLANGVTRFGISKGDIENSIYLIPDVKTQKAIINFLDSRTSQIDALISDKERLIKLLEEKRQAIITETVTKGLDPNVKMKDSGNGWIGEVPEHWGVGKIKYFSEMKTGATPSRNNLDYWEGGTINWMSSGEINQEYIYHVNNKITELGFKSSSTSLLPINTVMIALNGQGKTKGKAAILKVKSTCNQSLVGFICDGKNLHYLYLYYFLKSKYRDIRGLVGDGLRDGISLGLLKTLYISLPSYDEQVKIVKEIVSQEQDILKTIEIIKEQISKLKEYRESLIYEAVTGKIDVRDYATERQETY
ncbi:restriction endonuclease subunit S [Virgibacillus sp. YIM 98842]|uniref:restriction endonuclease subunit S n=1 Tax=Virgibacillus sp. YIM 98842 TaxID=2663533 RepID=UPI0013DC7A70|nr:restriction endonuclease subunit S [Virgibacillus sp. YIM 98842]